MICALKPLLALNDATIVHESFEVKPAGRRTART